MATQMRLRLISYSNEIIDGQPMYVSSNCLPVQATKYEPAGHSFHSVALQLRGFCEKEEAPADDHNTPSDKGQSYTASADSYSSKGKKKSGAAGQQQDHYALLGLGHLRFLATEEQIRKSYRETALKHHPDKQASLLLAEVTEAAKEAKKDEIESHFKSVQEAYEVLIDPVRRRLYDSTDEFDDEVPTDCAPQDFYKVFGPAFMRNGRWSVVQPVPSLGEDTTPLKEVDTFYDFWYGFKSWREFPHADEFELDQAESRDHKRWMERQNSKLREKARKEEYTRVRSLVDNAYRKDPRIIRRKEEEKAQKQKRKEAKYLEKKLQEEEAARAAEEAAVRKVEEDRLAAIAASNQKKIKEKEKKLLRKERARLRTVSASIVSQRLLDVTDDHVETICMSFEIEQLKNLCSELEEKEGTERAQLLRDAIVKKNDFNVAKQQDKNQVNQQQDKNQAGQQQDKNQVNQQANGSRDVSSNGKVENPLHIYEKKEKPWAKEEIEMLRKGIQKYPKGTSRRWEVISEYIGTGRTVEEILKATKTVLLQKPDSAKAFDSFLEKRKPTPTIASPLSTRQETGEVINPSNDSEADDSKAGTPEQSSSSNGSHQSSEPTPSSEDAWSAIQERALVQALKTFPKEANQRWERVATAVPGKTVNQCKKKFALLKENFRSKKN